MAILERTYTIPLRKEWLKAQRYKRAKKAIAGLRKFLQKHMKSENVFIGKHLNLEIWKRGIKCPPGKVKVNVSRDDKGVVFAELFGAEVPKVKKEDKKEASKTAVKTEVPKSEVKKEVKVEVKPVSKEPKKV